MTSDDEYKEGDSEQEDEVDEDEVDEDEDEHENNKRTRREGVGRTRKRRNVRREVAYGCQATINHGRSKGQRCNRAIKDGGDIYCGYHKSSQ